MFANFPWIRKLIVNKSVYIAKSGQLYDKTLKNFSLHVSNQALKDMYMLNYGIICIIVPSRC